MAKKKATTKTKRVLVTGAAGGLGVHITRALILDGWEVVAVDGRPLASTGRAPLLSGLEGVQWIHDELLGSEVRQALASVTAVVHASAKVNLSADEALLTHDNVEATRRLFEFAQEAGVEHFVHFSCAFVYAGETGAITEDSPTTPSNPYERSKLSSERALQRAARAKGSPALTILRPGWLYGPGCIQLGAGIITLPAILGEMTHMLPGLTGGPRTNWCHVSDAASAVVTVLATPDARGRIFNVADETPLSFGEVLTSIMEAYGFEVALSVPMPNVALWAILSPIIDHKYTFDRARELLLWAWRRVQREHGIKSPLRPRIDRNALFYVRDDAIIIADALREIGWSPQFPDFRMGVALTIRWYQEQGWLPRFDTESMVKRRDSRPATNLSYAESFQGDLHGSPLALKLRCSWKGLPLPPFKNVGVLAGRITVDGLTTEAPVQGTLEFTWLPRPEITYEFGFVDDQGNACRVSARRGIQTWRSLHGEAIDRRGESIGELGGTLERGAE